MLLLLQRAIGSSVYLNYYHPHGGGGYEDVGAVEAVNCMLLLSAEGQHSTYEYRAA